VKNKNVGKKLKQVQPLFLLLLLLLRRQQQHPHRHHHNINNLLPQLIIYLNLQNHRRLHQGLYLHQKVQL